MLRTAVFKIHKVKDSKSHLNTVMLYLKYVISLSFYSSWPEVILDGLKKMNLYFQIPFLNL